LKKNKNILFVSHDGNRAGAQIFLCNVMLYLKNNGYNIVLLIINDWGSFRAELEQKFETYYLNKIQNDNKVKSYFSKKENVLNEIDKKHNFDLIYANTIASVEILEKLDFTFNKPIITHIHELSYSIAQYGVTDSLAILNKYSLKVIACSNAVAQNLKQTIPELDAKTIVIHSFVDNQAVLQKHNETDVITFKNSKSISKTSFIVGACGNSDWRKAPDVFLNIVAQVVKKNRDIHFIWVGINQDDLLFNQLQYDAQKLNIEQFITWVSPTAEAISYINAFDVFMVCSREDPFPLVMLEAALCKKPILGFINTGGAEEFIETDCGYLSGYLDVNSMSENILTLYNKKEDLITKGENAKNKVLNLYSFEKSIEKILDLIESI
jgi:glycosyltransferase involved in cell wall biosynthesis